MKTDKIKSATSSKKRGWQLQKPFKVVANLTIDISMKLGADEKSSETLPATIVYEVDQFDNKEDAESLADKLNGFHEKYDPQCPVFYMAMHSQENHLDF